LVLRERYGSHLISIKEKFEIDTDIVYQTNTVMLLSEILEAKCPDRPQGALVAGSTNSADS
jgi:hypothetical protein